MKARDLSAENNWDQQIKDAYAINDALMKLVRAVENSCSHTRDNKERDQIMATYQKQFWALGAEIMRPGNEVRINYKSPIGYTIYSMKSREHKNGMLQDLIMELERARSELKHDWKFLGSLESKRSKKSSNLMEHARIHRQICETLKTCDIPEREEQMVCAKQTMNFSPMIAKALYAIQNHKNDWSTAKDAKTFWTTSQEDIEAGPVTGEMLDKSFERMRKIRGMSIADQIGALIYQNRTVRFETPKGTMDVHSGNTVSGIGAYIANFYLDNNQFFTEVSDDQMEIPPSIPESVISSAPGRPLDDIILHPLTSGMGIVVEDANSKEFRLAWTPVKIEVSVEELSTEPEGIRLSGHKIPSRVQIKL